MLNTFKNKINLINYLSLNTNYRLNHLNNPNTKIQNKLYASNNSLNSSFNFNILKVLKSYILNQIINSTFGGILNILISKVTYLLNKHPVIHYYISKADYYIKRITCIVTNVFNLVLVYLNINYPYIFKILLYTYDEYSKVITGDLKSKHINLLISLGIILNSGDYFKWLFIMLLSKLLKDYFINNMHYILSRKLFLIWPFLYDIVLGLLSALYIISLYSCMDVIYQGLIIPLGKVIINKINNIIVRMWGLFGWTSSSKNEPSSSSTSDPNNRPDPNSSPNIVPDNENKNKGNNNKKNSRYDKPISEEEFTKDQNNIKKELTRINKSMVKFNNIENSHKDKLTYSYLDLIKDYKDYLPESEQSNLIPKNVTVPKDMDTATQAWLFKKKHNDQHKKNCNTLFSIFERNSKSIQEQLGGQKTVKSEFFRKELSRVKDNYSQVYNIKNDYIKKQLEKSKTMDMYCKKYNIKFSDFSS